ncbi:methionyl-tRNA formyltransferase [Bartonella sp. HY329]|uniref:methionyl-tRNA formyltransferase n=1 Tax=unclassified Bartonella TaxID=2645622 RepID=UPI0021C574C3|nr:MULTISPECIES: methionyl-tRNA formyltransferase [unclassified Bartonella]UXM94483.1 methionyl-tRNA formyltransferase [Bartonella sp. HY329]UXN08807.1 methionyl-tRNA formyltransferase [Bartonella sp. HY328]
MRLCFMGTPDFSVTILDALVKAGHEIVAVYSQPPRPAGRRGLEFTPSPVQNRAEVLGLPVFTPKSLKSQEEQAKFAALNLDAAIVVAYGLLLPKAILDAPRLGCYNGHASLLPRWRGAAPIQRAIMAGDSETGMMIMKMDEGLDTGPVALTQSITIGEEMTAGQLHDALSQIGADLMVKAMDLLAKGELPLTQQSNEGITYAQKISKQETRIDWTQTARSVQKQICGLAPFPGSWCEMDIGGRVERVKILGAKLGEKTLGEIASFDKRDCSVQCQDGKVILTRLQKAGGKALNSDEFLRGNVVTSVI